VAGRLGHDGARRGRPWRTWLAVAFLSLQLVGVAWARFVPTRYFAWAPNDYAVEYSISAKVDGRALTAAEVESRYRLAQHGLYEFPPEHLIDGLRSVERLYPRGRHGEVHVRYRLDGHAPRAWSFVR
jgi:hypothetical protein